MNQGKHVKFSFNINKNLFYSLLFLFIVVIITLFYDYQDILFFRPQSIHYWRQADCTSLALNYYNHGMHFFSPEIHNLISDDMKTGYCVSEFPIIYYFVAILYKIFGYHEFLFRLVNVLIFLSGIMGLFKLFKLHIQNYFWSITLTLLFFTSPFLIYYGNNFLSDIPALSLVIWGWYFFFRFYQEHKFKYFIISSCFFLIATLLKITSLINLGAVMGIFVLEWTGLIHFEQERIFKKSFQYITIFILFLLIIGAWYFWALHYNQQHKNPYFLTKPWPIWDIPRFGYLKTVDQVWTAVINNWKQEFFSYSIFWLIGHSLLAVLILARWMKSSLLIIVLISLSGFAAYYILWFGAMAEHDYYMIGVMILPVFIMLTLFEMIARRYPSYLSSRIAIAIMIALLIYNIGYAKHHLNKRYTPEVFPFYEYNEIARITPYLRSIGITNQDKVISFHDFTPDYTLYLMDQPGWTSFNQYTDSAAIAHLVSLGAKYLVLNTHNNYYLPYSKNLLPFMNKQVGEYEGIEIYQLSGTPLKEYEEPAKQLIEQVECNIESLDPSKRLIASRQPGVTFDNLYCRSAEKARSGQYSIKLNNQYPYGLTHEFKNLKPGEKIQISIWKYGADSLGSIIATNQKKEKYYMTSNQIKQKDSQGWKRCTLKLTIPSNYGTDGLFIYLYNPSKQPVYFDDFFLKRYL